MAFTYVLDSVLNGKLKPLPEAWPFLKPVNKKLVKDYYNIVKNPMDLETVAKKIKAHKYHNRTEFLHDLDLILENSIAYNGQESQFTEKAKALGRIAAETLEEYGDHLNQLEANIRIAQKKADEENEFLDVEEDDDDDDYVFDPMDPGQPPRIRERPGEDEWDPELEMQPVRGRKNSRKSISQAAGPSAPPKPKGKRGRPPKNKKPP